MSGAPHALVTGATRGIGRAVVEQLLARGRRVVACGRDAQALAELERAHPGRVIGLTVDLSQPGAALATVDEALGRVGALSELVYAAGIVHYAPVGAIGEQPLRAQLELNFFAAFAMLQQAGLHMRAQGGGALVVIASTLALHPAPLTSAYAASKAALISAARSFALELAPEVRVNVVAPGVVDTDMVRVPRRPQAADEPSAAAVAARGSVREPSVEPSAAARAQISEAQLAELRSLHPLARLGSPEDVAAAVLYLLEASWVTGSVLTVDGGLTVK
jgi:3-oxoacyl-[acyl-carrier protein] reductase